MALAVAGEKKIRKTYLYHLAAYCWTNKFHIRRGYHQLTVLDIALIQSLNVCDKDMKEV